VTTSKKKSLHINRWIVALLLVAVVVLGVVVKPAQPEVSLAAESLLGYGENHKPIPMLTLPLLGEIPLVNTLVTTVIVDLVVIVLALVAARGIHVDGSPSRGVAGIFETIFGAIYNLVENTVGKKWARQVFPLVATIILLVLTANLLKLFPGMESIGLIKESHGEEAGNKIIEIIPGLAGLTAEKAEHGGYHLVPFFRSPSTDLNFTASLAIIAVVMVQVFGVRANGPAYFGKFLNFGRFVKMWVRKDLNAFDVINPLIDIFVGVLEFISECARVISFSFRLLGVMFGGTVLVIVLGSILPVTQFGLLFLELFFGVIQALVFGVLTMVFIAIATMGHDEHSEGHGEVQAAHA